MVVALILKLLKLQKLLKVAERNQYTCLPQNGRHFCHLLILPKIIGLIELLYGSSGPICYSLCDNFQIKNGLLVPNPAKTLCTRLRNVSYLRETGRFIFSIINESTSNLVLIRKVQSLQWLLLMITGRQNSRLSAREPNLFSIMNY